MKWYIILLLIVFPVISLSQQNVYYTHNTVEKIIYESGRDSVIFLSRSDKMPVRDSSILIYHETFPDSLYPSMAIVIGNLYITSEKSAEQAFELFEKYAKQLGANYIVNFSEPRLKRVAKKSYYHTNGMLLYVLQNDMVHISSIKFISR